MARPVQSVEKLIKEALPKDAKFLLAVSGGIDSMVLLHACYRLQGYILAKFEVAHVDHKLRKTSGADASFVKREAARLKIPFHLCRASKKKVRENVESWGRRIRYEFFAKVLKKRKLDWVLTAHQANDCAETLIMRLVSNKEPRSISKIDETRKVIRPLLTVPRTEIEVYAEEKKVSYREDETNLDPKYLRNKVRHRILPVLAKEFDPRIIEILAERADGIAQDIELLEIFASRIAAKTIKFKWGGREWITCIRRELSKIEFTIQWRVVENLLFPKLGFKLGRRKGQAVVRFFLENIPRIELPTGVILSRKNGEVNLRRSDDFV